MNRLLKCFSLILVCVSLASCAMMGRVDALPQGSTVALITGLDNKITYDFVGTTVFQNDHFQYDSKRLSINRVLINPVKRSLENAGYKVIVLNVPVVSPLNHMSSLTGSLSTSEKKYLLNVIGGASVKRVVVLTKSTPYIYETPTQDAVGYGYFQRSVFGIKNTISFGALSVVVVDMDDLKVKAVRSASLLDDADKYLFHYKPQEVSAQSIDYINQWLKDKFAANVISTLKKMGTLN